MKSPKTVKLNVQLCKGKFSNKLQRIRRALPDRDNEQLMDSPSQAETW